MIKVSYIILPAALASKLLPNEMTKMPESPSYKPTSSVGEGCVCESPTLIIAKCTLFYKTKQKKVSVQ